MDYRARRGSRGQRGQFLVTYTMVLLGLLAAVALCSDIALLYLNYIQLQKAADAAAVAGAEYLPWDPSQAPATATQYVGINGKSGDQILSPTPQVFNNDTEIKVTLERTVPLFFTGVFGYPSIPINVTATAGVEAVGGATCFMPIGFPLCQARGGDCYAQDLQSCTLQTFTYNNNQVSPGNWDWLTFGGNGGNQLRQNLDYGACSSTVSIGQLASIDTKPGDTVGALPGLQDRLSRSCYSDSYVPCNGGSTYCNGAEDSRLVLMPVVDFNQANGYKQVPIIKFVSMWIASVSGNGNGNNPVTITGYFISGAPAIGIPDPNAPNTGAWSQPALLQ